MVERDHKQAIALCEIGTCVSMAEARRLVIAGAFRKLVARQIVERLNKYRERTECISSQGEEAEVEAILKNSDQGIFQFKTVIV